MNIEPTDADRRMVEPVMEIARTSDLPGWALTLLRGRAAMCVAMAREEGRRSVGLGDFLPHPCGEEYSSYPWYIAETYGDYVSCSLRRGHDGKHEHQDSGMTWTTR